MQAQVEKVSVLLQEKKLRLAVAESCTGGGLAYWLTSLAGSSAWFERGFVTYSNHAKEEILGVQPATLATFGAVSEHTVREMAEGTLRFSAAQISVAITGIAGPSGGSAEKPVGLVWIACAGLEKKLLVRENYFAGDRTAVREQAIATSLEMLLEFLQ